MGKLIDVIVPIYKVEQYLHKCVDSLLNQNFDDYIITLVDDGSPDKCPDICDEYQRKHPEKIRVIHKENGGLSDARNVGVLNSEAQYIIFVDSDDYVSPDYIKDLYDAHIKYDADVVVSNMCRVFINSDGSERKDFRTVQEDVEMDRETALEELFYERKFGAFAWAKLYPRNVLLKFPYPKGKYFEDSFTTYKILNECNKIVCIKNINYFYLQRGGSIQRRSFEEKHMDLYYSVIETEDYFKNLNVSEKVRDALSYRFCRAAYITLMHAVQQDNDGYFKIHKEIKDAYKIHLKKVMNSKCSQKERLLFYIAGYYPRVFRVLIKLIKT
ncbi:MAG: glycosyltransferase family 2 protein [Ruminococcaceae bacterium]|nr:glycosyltransferase family 2 protein [Oscillospiraceae bacterium]